jgi:hypothetical protein
VVQPATETMRQGRYAVVDDPEGNDIGSVGDGPQG